MPPPSGSTESAATRDGRAAKIGERRKKVLDHVREHPGRSQREIADALGLPQPSVCTHLQGLRGQVRVEKDGPRKRYYADEAPATGEERANGTRSKLEDAVVKAIATSSSGLYVEGIRTTIDYEPKPSHDAIDKVCRGLLTRGVLQRATDDSYQLPS